MSRRPGQRRAQSRHGAVAHNKVDLLLGYPQRTIFESLAADGHDFAVYFKTIPTVLFYRRLRMLRYATLSFHRPRPPQWNQTLVVGFPHQETHGHLRRAHLH